MKLKPFQQQDLARAALHDGLILAWDTGLGKTWAMFLWPLLKLGHTLEPDAPAATPNSPLPTPNFHLRPNGPVLIVAPGDLHPQIIEEAQTRFRAQVTPIPTQEAYLNLVTLPAQHGQPPSLRPLPPGYYICSYTQLGTNGVRKFPALTSETADPDLRALAADLSFGPEQCQAFFADRAKHFADAYATLEIDPEADLPALEIRRHRLLQETRDWPDREAAATRYHAVDSAYDTLLNLYAPKPKPTFAALSLAQQTWILRHALRRHLAECADGIRDTRDYPTADPVGRVPTPGASPLPGGEGQGEGGIPTPNSPLETHNSPLETPPFKVRCLYSPSLADLSCDSFPCVVVDEGVKMKGEATLIGRAVRLMNPPHRLVLTATPIKNRLGDIFLLAWWAAGAKPEPHARFPYAGEPEDIEDFAETFLVTERNLSAKDPEKKNSRRLKRTAEVCNIHRLWKLLAPVVLRRRKGEVGEQIVPKHRHVVRVPMGTSQAETYGFHMEATYKDANGLPAIGARLQALRLAAAAPDSLLLAESNCLCAPLPQKGQRRSSDCYTPKVAAALKLILAALQRGEQIILGSAFTDPLATFAALLGEAGVPCAVMDGETGPVKRGKLSALFKAGKTAGANALPVVLAGVECMAEGHNFWRCPNAILFSYSWAHDKFEQFINRIHRLNSPRPVQVWSLVCDGTIDRVLEESIHEKGDSSELVLDGKLVNARPAELSLPQLLQIAESEFNPQTKTIDEQTLRAEWPLLRAQLNQAWLQWHETNPADSEQPAAPAPARSVLDCGSPLPLSAAPAIPTTQPNPTVTEPTPPIPHSPLPTPTPLSAPSASPRETPPQTKIPAPSPDTGIPKTDPALDRWLARLNLRRQLAAA